MQKMSKHSWWGALVLVIGLWWAAPLPVQPAAATSIDTTSSDDGNISEFGSPGTTTYGQTFTASGPDTQLDSFSLFLRDRYFGSGTLDLRGYIASWDSVNFHASSVLFESATQTMNAAGTLQEFAFSPGGLDLIASQQYVAYLSISNLPPQPPSTFGMPDAGAVLSGGQFVYLDSGTDPSPLTSSPWNTFGERDVWFKASLSAPVPEPSTSTLLLLGAGLVGLAAWRLKHTT